MNQQRAAMFGPMADKLTPLVGKVTTYVETKDTRFKQGVVSNFTHALGFGMIKESKSGKEYFVHFSDVQPLPGTFLRMLVAGWEVDFVPSTDPAKDNRHVARQVRLVEATGIAITKNEDGDVINRGTVNLLIDESGKVVPSRTARRSIEAMGVKLYTAAGRIDAVRLATPLRSIFEWTLLLDKEKQIIEGDVLPPGGYVLHLRRDGQLTIQRVGRRYEKVLGNTNYLVVEDRLSQYIEHVGRATLEDIAEQLFGDGTGLAINRAEFAPAVFTARNKIGEMQQQKATSQD